MDNNSSSDCDQKYLYGRLNVSPTIVNPYLKYIIVAVCLGLLNQPVFAAYIYTYVGNNFEFIFDDPATPGTYTTEMRVSGYFALENPLNASMPLTYISDQIVEFEFTEGRNTINAVNAISPRIIGVATDNNGNITGWDIRLSTEFPNPLIPGDQRWGIETTSNFLPIDADLVGVEECSVVAPGGESCGDPFDSIPFEDRASTALSPGTWTVSTQSSVPLPAMIPAFAAALGMLFGWIPIKRTLRNSG